ncbi:MAG: GDP-mannose 4,6-dehydratase [Acidobacteriia bacterium]|nr:GDP-mannose 4,6-dehydratase [Terriglobia bacterium]
MNYWRDKRVLVTGATGIVGSWLIKELLDRRAFVAALVLDADPQTELFRSGNVHRVAVVNGRLEEIGDIERAINVYETETVIHLGAQTIVPVAHRNPLATFEANIRGTYHLLEACRRQSVLVKQVVVASSDKAYGEQPELPYTEDMPLHGRHPYDVSKACVEHLAMAYHHSYGLPVAVSRCGNIYGGGDLNWSRIVPGTIRSLLRGERPVLRSDGTFLRDYLYVKDAAEAYLCLAEAVSSPQMHGEVFNFGPASPVSVIELVTRLQKLLGREDLCPQILNSAAGEIRNQYLSAEKARRSLHWTCEYDLDRGLAETVEWYRTFFEDQAA